MGVALHQFPRTGDRSTIGRGSRRTDGTARCGRYHLDTNCVLSHERHLLFWMFN